MSTSSVSSSASAPARAPRPSSATPQPSGKRRYHNGSSFYLFCKDFVESCTKNGRTFRISKHGFESAALKWNTLSTVDKENWKNHCRAERKKAKADGTVQKLKVRNGDRGDPNADPTELATMKDFGIKKSKDVADLKNRWTWNEGLDKERFLIVSADVDLTGEIPVVNSLALIEVDLKLGITDDFHEIFDSAGKSTTAVKYQAIDRILNWPFKFNRVRGGSPVYFTPNDQLREVFEALTFVDSSTPGTVQWNEKRQVSFNRDLTTVDVLRTALCEWFEKPVLEAETKTGNDDPGKHCLEKARRCAIQLLEMVSF